MNWSCVERLSCCSVVTVAVNRLYLLSCFCSVRVETYLCVCVCVVVVLFLNLLLFWIILSVLIFLLCHFPAHRTQKRWCHISNFKDDWSQTLNRLWERCWIYTSVPDLRALIPTVFEHDGYQSDPDCSDRSDRSDSCLSLLIWMWGEKFILEL